MHSAKTIYNNSISEKVSETYNKTMEKQYLSISPKNTGEKRKDQENIIVITITIMTITMTMIMTEIVGPETGINQSNRDRSYSRDRS